MIADPTSSPDAAIVRLSGPIDERFTGIKPPPSPILIIDAGGITQINSIGVKRWVSCLEGLPGVSELYFVNCPLVFVDQLNMVLRFCGRGKVITAFAPFFCNTCEKERAVLIDVHSNHVDLAKGTIAPERCDDCGAAMTFDESPSSYFYFVKSHAATSLSPAAASALFRAGLYHEPSSIQSASESARAHKLLYKNVTYFRVVGAIDDMFRSRAFRDGLSSEVVFDLREVTALSAAGCTELSRLFGALSPSHSVTLIDVPPLVGSAVESGRIALGGAKVYSAETAGQLSPNTVEVIANRDQLMARQQIEARISTQPSASKQILGKYRVVRSLSSGGMAEVFLAVQEGIGGFEKQVALKRIRRQILEGTKTVVVALFLDEARLSATLSHPNIVQIFDVGEDDGELYLAMEYVPGIDLRVLMQTVRRHSTRWIELADALKIVHAVAQALHAAHTATDHKGRPLQIVHRDISPSNVLLDRLGNVKLADFGVASSAVSLVDRESGLVGKPGYLSPEQARGSGFDHRTDLFSLGIVLYELCVGNHPFLRPSRDATIAASIAGAYTPVAQLDSRIPPEIDQLIASMLAPDPNQRIASAEAVTRAIRDIASRQGINLAEPLRLELDALIAKAGTDTRRARVVDPVDAPARSYSEELLGTTQDLVPVVDTPIVKPR